MNIIIWVWFNFCFTALRHILGHFGRGQFTKPHCSWASLLGSLPVLYANSFASNWQLLFLNQRKRQNGHRNVFMTKSPWKNVPDVGIELGAACVPSELTSDGATAPVILLFRIMSPYDATFDLKINVGHCDVYSMVQWFCLISWLFDVSTLLFGIMS